MTTSTLQSILAEKGAEFFTFNDKPMVTYHRQQYDLVDAPEYIHNALSVYLLNNPDKATAYEDMAGKEGAEGKCVKCMFANLDGVPDLSEYGDLTPEYVECPNRGNCKWEGIGCLPSINKFGLSRREKEIIELAELTNNEIGLKLFLSMHTISTHLQNIERKCGVKNKKQLIKIRESIWH